MPSTDFSPEVVDRYRKVRELAMRGEGGEKEAAARRLAKMEQSNPGLASHVTQLDIEAELGDFVEPEYPSDPEPHGGAAFFGQTLHGIFGALRAGSQALGMVQRVSVTRSRTPTGGIILTVVIPDGDWDAAERGGHGEVYLGLLLQRIGSVLRP